MPRIDSSADDDVWLNGVPVDVRNGTEMRPQNMFDGRPAAHEEVPYETIPRNVRIGARCFGGVLTVSRWTWKQCTHYGMGVGSTGHRPRPMCRPEGGSYPIVSTMDRVFMNGTYRGTLKGASKSMINKPFRLRAVNNQEGRLDHLMTRRTMQVLYPGCLD